ncbi:hypothetical protein bcgnr5378_04880 [Bacillus cereus]|uniref:Uncharacterized protein n=1 Tax=Bacillus cereus TaxID=1396 RepID=A0A164LEI1_BACCE|nr:hypothetical protein [Bacillus cereus]KZD55729.1 hypothetical protein B4088_5474 [Bacillus cereus]
MIQIKCTYENDDYINTPFNGNLREAEEYYLGEHFNLGKTTDNMQKCIKVEEIK